ncbi:MAG TPA: serine--tRNA ligase [Methanoregulaceae archaeon]|nr:serine--tRNA ligase [Methanoregulaceae archaeon]
MQPRFGLTADLIFSREIPDELRPELDRAVEEANTALFRKGVPKDAPADEIGRITGYAIAGPVLTVTFESGGYTRAHDALFRFRKQVTGQLGRHRIGLREIVVVRFRIELRGTVPEGLRLAALPFVRSAEVEPDRIVLELAVTAADLENRIPDRLIRLVEEKAEAAAYGGKGEHWELLYESPRREFRFREDPTAEMIRRGWIKHALSRGQWIHGPQSTRLFRAFEALVLEEIVGPLGFAEMIFPKLVPWEVWAKSGHAKGVYPEIYYVSVPKTRDPAYWEDVADYFKVTGEVPVDLIREKVDGPIGGLCYAQCPSFWPFLGGATLTNDSLPARVFDRSGTSHRYESGGIHGIERVDEFHRIELLWLGTPEQTVETADLLHERYRRLFDEVLELEWRSARVTPWFMAQEGMLGGEGASERIGTTDYEAYLPYSDSWLEFQNVSVNGDKYPRGFNVKVQSGGDLWSGCSGIGLERWTAAFLAQKGFDLDDWPAEIRRRFGDAQEIFRFV